MDPRPPQPGAAAPVRRFRPGPGPGELRALLGVLAAALALLAFFALAEAVLEGETRAFDRAVLLALRARADPSDPAGPRWLEEAARDVTALGSTAILGFATLAVAGYLALARRRAAARLVLVAVAGGALLSSLLKLGFERPRPDLVPHAAAVYTASFPSGHAMLSAVTWLTLGALLMRIEPRRRVKAYVLAMAVLTTLLVGASRIYLGVHWPTDVLAGWSLGAAWALLCWLVALRLQRRGRVEPDGPA
ncbi:phosphatase PAP2 family protein [Caldovatus aquaticus]|uniref:Phosphatase PAP2 family protein n=1 Tax=Caldovatus aquaticus TaxID=2865671 RepID=A0ABS7EXG3_9PROT|nr:phosphatase PAP2 family protein [Caldovatus aquaticus]MBW8268055.1 phosphatase PAP2 family protein [Caldovatus aquaticus]